MTDKKEHVKQSMKSTTPADCVTEIRIGNFVVSGFFKKDRYYRYRSRQNGKSYRSRECAS